MDYGAHHVTAIVPVLCPCLAAFEIVIACLALAASSPPKHDQQADYLKLDVAASGDDAGLRLPPRLAPVQVRSSSAEMLPNLQIAVSSHVGTL